jgi:hypothetical protein
MACRGRWAAPAAAVVLAGCGGVSGRPPSPAAQARAAVQRYVDALGAKDARAACAAMSVQGQRATGGTGAACATNVEEAIAVDQTSYKGAKATTVVLSRDHAIVEVHLAGGGITRLSAVRERRDRKYQATAL